MTKVAKRSEENQHARFIETARKLDADQDPDALDRVFGKVVPPVVPKAPEPRSKRTKPKPSKP